MKTYFQNKTVVITGGSSGIGKALVTEMLAHGANVAVCGRKQAALNELQQQVNSSQLFTFVADVSVEADCKAFIESVISKFGKIDILVNNAGISMRALFRDLEVSR